MATSSTAPGPPPHEGEVRCCIESACDSDYGSAIDCLTWIFEGHPDLETPG